MIFVKFVDYALHAGYLWVAIFDNMAANFNIANYWIKPMIIWIVRNSFFFTDSFLICTNGAGKTTYFGRSKIAVAKILFRWYV